MSYITSKLCHSMMITIWFILTWTTSENTRRSVYFRTTCTHLIRGLELVRVHSQSCCWTIFGWMIADCSVSSLIRKCWLRILSRLLRCRPTFGASRQICPSGSLFFSWRVGGWRGNHWIGLICSYYRYSFMPWRQFQKVLVNFHIHSTRLQRIFQGGERGHWLARQLSTPEGYASRHTIYPLSADKIENGKCPESANYQPAAENNRHRGQKKKRGKHLKGTTVIANEKERKT